MTGLIDLNPNYFAIVERILAEHVPECEVRAFGSRHPGLPRTTPTLISQSSEAGPWTGGHLLA